MVRSDQTVQLPQVHVRVEPALKRALRIYCAREGTTEQQWVTGALEERLALDAPDLWPERDRKKRTEA